MPPRVVLDWRLYNTFGRAFTCDTGVERGPEYADTGTSEVDAVLGSGWSSGNEVALALAEVGGASRTIGVVLDPARQGVPLLNFRLALRRRAGDEDRGVLQAGAVFDATLVPREALLLTLSPAPCAGPACRYRVYRGPAPDDVPLLAEATGHSYADPVLDDGRTWFYLVDDGGGFPPDTLRVTRGPGAVELAW